MINLSFDELRLIPQVRNISGYENKSKKDLIKALSEPKPETLKPKTKPEIPKQTLKPEAPTPEKKPKSNTKTNMKTRNKIRSKI